jgi:hypothetical protein
MKRMLPGLLLLFSLLAGVVPLSAQTWDELHALKPGDRITVLDTGGQQRKGVFTAVSPDSISLQSNQSVVAIDRTRVRRVQLRLNSRRVRNIVIGVAIGVATGLIADQTIGRYLRNESDTSGRPLIYIVPIALFGGISAAFPGYRTVYRAP